MVLRQLQEDSAMSRSVRIAAMVVCLAGVGVATTAYGQGPKVEAGAAADVMAMGPVEMPPGAKADVAEAKRWAQKSIDAARAAERFWITMRSETYVKREGQEGKTTPDPQKWEFLAQGDRWSVRSELSNYGGDAERLWTHATSVGQWAEWLRSELDGVKPVEWMRAQTNRDVATSSALDARLSPEETLEEVWSRTEEWLGVLEGTRLGRPGAWVYIRVAPERWGAGTSMLVMAWIDAESGRVLEQRIDRTTTFSGLRGGPDSQVRAPVEFAVHTIFLDYKDLAGPIDEAEFKPKLAESDRRVDRIDWRELSRKMLRERADLLGKPAPEVDLPLLGGGRQKLSDLKGRVVLIDFWATWCGPCLVAMPKLQAISERFKDQPVTVLGLNIESDMADDHLKKVIGRRGVTFPQMIQGGQKQMKAFRVNGIPHLVLIDQQGVVQDFHVGSGEDLEQLLIGQIEKLLAGQSLATEEAIAAKQAESTSGDDRTLMMLSRPTGRLKDNIGAERVTRIEMPFNRVRGLGSVSVDLDGDGRLTTVLSGNLGGDEIMGGAPALWLVPDDVRPPRAVPLARFPVGRSITGVSAATIGGQRRFVLAVGPEWAGMGEEASTGWRVMVYGLDGKQLLSVPTENPMRSIASDSLKLADGREVLVVAVQDDGRSVAKQPPDFDSRIMGRLMVIDMEGKILLRRALGDSPYQLKVLDHGAADRPNMIQILGWNAITRLSIDTNGW
jgi:thiol-disulfide isomerase/thioredoxin